MAYPSTQSPAFLTTVGAWIEQDAEVFVLVRYHAAGGTRDHEFHSSMQAFEQRLSSLPERACVTVIRGRHLALRGVVDDALIQQALSTIEDGREWLVQSFEKTVAGSAWWYAYAAGESLAELESDLQDYRGQRVAIGVHPDWLEDNDVVVSAVVPDADGAVGQGSC